MTDSTSLDSRAVLGLLAKANEMFASESTSLSFPVGTPMAYDTAELLAAMAPGPDARAHARLAEFSTLMNIIPEGTIWSPRGTVGLDDIVREVVGADWAEAERSAADEARYVAARALVDLSNPAMAEYTALKDAWIRAKEKLAKDRDDLAAQASEQANRAALVAYPFRAQIEQALQDLVALDERAPHRTRDLFQQKISQGYGSFDDAIVGSYSPVRLLPPSVLSAPNWDSVTLDRPALEQLAQSAPEALRARLAVDASASDPIERISFEYASVLLHRSWLEPNLFKLRCWKFPDPARLLSDGQSPAKGECTSYVCALVLARKVTVTTVVPAANAPSAPAQSSARFLVAKPEAVLMRPIDRERRAISKQQFELKPNLAQVRSATPQQLAQTRAVKQVANTQLRTELIQPAVRLDQVMLSESFAKDARAINQVRMVVPIDWMPKPLPPPPPPQTGLETTSTPAGTVVVLALICKAVPLAPNPSPECTWP